MINVIDRVPTQELPNGAIRYGIYDANGNLLRYEYIKREDEPTSIGTPINKALFDSINTDFGTLTGRINTTNNNLNALSTTVNNRTEIIKTKVNSFLITTGTISSNERIPENSGYDHSIYIVSINHLGNSGLGNTVSLEVNQTTRKVTISGATYTVANYWVISWNDISY